MHAIRDGDDDVDISDWKDVSRARFNPDGLSHAAAPGTVTIEAGVPVGDLARAVVALIEMTAQDGSATFEDVAHDAVLVVAERTELLNVISQDVGQLRATLAREQHDLLLTA
jgi:hypothetical protein